MAIPSQALEKFKEGVETRREVPKFFNEYGKEIVQTTNVNG